MKYKLKNSRPTHHDNNRGREMSNVHCILPEKECYMCSLAFPQLVARIGYVEVWVKGVGRLDLPTCTHRSKSAQAPASWNFSLILMF